MAAQQGSEFVKTTGSFAGYLLGMCPPGEATIQEKPEVLNTERPWEGNKTMVLMVSQPKRR